MSKPAVANASTNSPTASVTAPIAWVTLAWIASDSELPKASSGISVTSGVVVTGSSIITSLD